MDSAHSSASLQSSSGGDEEYDSRHEPISAMAAASSDQSLLLPHSSPFSGAGHFQSYFDAFPRPPAQPVCASLDGWLDRGAGGPIATSSAAAAIVSPYARPASAVDAGGGGGGGGNSKKRSRASRRAPTTVLTTDTSNFRAMVQEFTGIPAPPFSSSSTSGISRSRFDLFSGVSQPPYQLLLRPRAGHPNISGGVTSATTPRSGSDHQTLPKQYQNLLNIGNTLLPLQSLMQQPTISPPKYPLNNFPLLPHKSQFSTAASSGVAQPYLTMGLLDEMTAAQGHVSSASSSPLSINIPPSWSGATPKMKYASDSVDQFHGQKDQDQINVSSRPGEGMVDYSWICSSD